MTLLPASPLIYTVNILQLTWRRWITEVALMAFSNSSMTLSLLNSTKPKELWCAVGRRRNSREANVGCWMFAGSFVERKNHKLKLKLYFWRTIQLLCTCKSKRCMSCPSSKTQCHWENSKNIKKTKCQTTKQKLRACLSSLVWIVRSRVLCLSLHAAEDYAASLKWNKKHIFILPYTQIIAKPSLWFVTFWQ